MSCLPNEDALFPLLVGLKGGLQYSLLSVSQLDKSLWQSICVFSTGGTKQIDPLV